MDYERYLDSPHWRRTRVAFWAQVDRRCVVCGAQDKLHIHHRTYERLGREQWSDLIPLCERCHTHAHLLVNNGQAELWDAHLKIGPVEELPPTPGRIISSGVLRADSTSRRFDVGSVPLYVEGRTYTGRQLDMMATHLLWLQRKKSGGRQGRKEDGMILSDSEWRGIREREVYTGDGTPPDEALIRGLFVRSYPGRPMSVGEDPIQGRSGEMARNMVKPMNAFAKGCYEAEERKANRTPTPVVDRLSHEARRARREMILQEQSGSATLVARQFGVSVPYVKQIWREGTL